MDNSLSVRGTRSVVLRVAIGDFNHMTERTVFFPSDQTGVTAETLGHSLLTQFDGQQFRQITLPFIDSDDKANDALARINAAAEKDGVHPIVFSNRVVKETGEDTGKQVTHAFQLAFGRQPKPIEAKAAIASAKTHGLATLCRVLFNSNEFLFLP